MKPILVKVIEPNTGRVVLLQVEELDYKEGYKPKDLTPAEKKELVKKVVTSAGYEVYHGETKEEAN